MAARKALALAGAAVVATCCAAHAVDLPPAPSLEAPEEPAAPQFNGWYLRGDLGIGFEATTPDLVYSPDPPASGAFSPAVYQSFSGASIAPSGFIDIGAGYQVNQWFRGDLTLEYRDGGNFESLYTLNDPTAKTHFDDFYRGNVSSVVAMINGYASPGTWYGFTPFVGVGIGFAHNSLNGMTDQALTTIDGGPTGRAGRYFGNGSTDNFAWAVMAGLDFNVTDTLKLELGYRYLDRGKISSGSSSCRGGTLSIGVCGGSTSYISSLNTLASNDFRIGLIWTIGATPPAALVRKD
jgi:opacity protein-like surface antigen